MRLSDFVEQISEDFKSTFTVVDEDTLANMMGFKEDFAKVTKIISKYLPNKMVWFSKTNSWGADETYDIYLIKCVSRD